MQVFAQVNKKTDVPFWVKRSDFDRHFDQDDFLNREVRDVQDAYLNDWFNFFENGVIRFYIPVVGLVSGKTDLISSRHRLAVLLPHLEELPFAFATAHLNSDDRIFLASIPKRPLDLSATFWIPDFPIRESLPWPIHN
jgi:hypothetical protein